MTNIDRIIEELDKKYEILLKTGIPAFTDFVNAYPALRDAIRELQKQAEITGETSDGYHTFNELYEYRMVYNALVFNEWAQANKYDVHKSKRHHDGEECFGGGWFVVVAETPKGQISNHYENEYWGLFNVPSKEVANEYDGHTPQEALKRMRMLAEAYNQATKDV